MIKVLEKNKNVVIEDGKITVSAVISIGSFNGCDKDNHSMFFTMFPVKFVGVATLKDGDTNNEVEATRIAESKMERAYYRYIKNCQKECIKNCTNILNKMTKALTRTETNIKKTNSHIEEICKRL